MGKAGGREERREGERQWNRCSTLNLTIFGKQQIVFLDVFGGIFGGKESILLAVLLLE